MTQETFFRALRAIGSFDGRRDIRAWLFTIARNAYFTYCRRRKLQAELPEDPADPDPSPGVIERLMDQESALAIHKFLHDMPEPGKEVFTLRVFGELSFDKIAAIFGRSSGWARVTFYRAKKQIMEYMEGLEHE